MRIAWLKPLVGHPGPFATVYLDATRSIEAGDKNVANRWRSVRRSLAKQGATDDVLTDLDEAVDRPTRVRGPHGRVLIADDEDGVLVDRVLREPPPVTAGVWHRVPVLLQAARSADEQVDAVCVAVDRLGADFTPVGTDGYAAGERETFEAPHDEVSKSSSTSTKRATIESRAEDSWERNAEAVAGEIDRRVADHRPEIVMITGDVRAVNLVKAELGQQAAEVTVEVPGGGRDEGVHQHAFAESVADALDSYRERRREQVLADLREGLGRESGAVTSIDDVVQVLARGQVDQLVLSEELADDASRALHAWVDGSVEALGLGGLVNGRQLWTGPDPLHVAVSRTEIEGVGELEELPAATALLRAAIGQDAGLVFAPEGSVDLRDGVGATLRWDDGGTPHESAASMSGDDGRVSAAH
ncbi:Vms1/Ankzf1 family peptidyl-tRNA hydrolase [Isoptericola chiayiensis]|uniref:Vms1/Ankzf1 family peptidyl-tRNA hydrolase n=1 Tax=Isoptericola chiayiensis TaxID=579446 RepID=A0ABP8YA50_9MICO|nr:hypothetical protein [Isoptericola chiayiensis]NOW02420.1 hypothetical protein [Isoptericola chiayiensis]